MVVLSEGSSVKGNPEDKQPSAPCIRGSAKISQPVTLALYTRRSACSRACMATHAHPPPMDRQMPVKILPCPKLRLQAVTICDTCHILHSSVILYLLDNLLSNAPTLSCRPVIPRSRALRSSFSSC